MRHFIFKRNFGRGKVAIQAPWVSFNEAESMIINRACHVIISRHNGSEASGHTQCALSALFKASTTNGRKYQSLVWGARHRESPEGYFNGQHCQNWGLWSQVYEYLNSLCSSFGVFWLWNSSFIIPVFLFFSEKLNFNNIKGGRKKLGKYLGKLIIRNRLGKAGRKLGTLVQVNGQWWRVWYWNIEYLKCNHKHLYKSVYFIYSDLIKIKCF